MELDRDRLDAVMRLEKGLRAAVDVLRKAGLLESGRALRDIESTPVDAEAQL